MNGRLTERLTLTAHEFGFTALAFASLEPVIQTAPLHPQAQSLTGDAASLMPDAKCIMLLAMPYRPFHYEGNDGRVDAYYPTSNTAHDAVLRMAKRVEEVFSIHALPSPPVYLKPLAARSGLGEFGKNCLISVGTSGTRVALQSILLNADCETQNRPARALSAMCRNCNACVNACPTQALRGDGTLDLSRCLRAQPEGQAFPEPLRPMLGASLLGCDLCQRVCPRNASVSEIPVPDALAKALNLRALLSGEYKPLVPFLGKNNARRQRLTARAVVAAANLNRTDLLPLIEPLSECKESEMVREHAAWAIKRLTKR